MLATIAGVILRTVLRGRKPPASRPATFTGRGAVVCLGASTVHGTVSYNWVDELARRRPDLTFVNAGVNGDTSAQVLARVPEVVACHPTDVIVTVGANDLFAIRGARLSAGRRTTFDEYRDNLTAIVRGLAPARVALMSVQPLGEVLDSPENADMDHLNGIMRAVADAEGATYLPFNEQLKTLLLGGDQPFRDSLPRVLVAMVLRLGVGLSLDLIGRLNGYRAHTEGLHLASPAGLLAADLVEAHLAAVSAEVPGAARDS